MYIGLLAILEILVLGSFFSMMRPRRVSSVRPRSTPLFAKGPSRLARNIVRARHEVGKKEGMKSWVVE
jgi:hypothetical protein